MKINYRILSVEEDQHSMVVRYWTDKITEEMLAIEFEPNGKIRKTKHGWPVRCSTDYNLNFYNNYDPSKEEVNHYIMKNAPIEWLKLKEEILDPRVKMNLDSVKQLVNKDSSFEVNI